MPSAPGILLSLCCTSAIFIRTNVSQCLQRGGVGSLFGGLVLSAVPAKRLSYCLRPHDGVKPHFLLL